MAWDWMNPDNRRWYHAQIVRSLLGDVVFETRWGGHCRTGMRVRQYPIRNKREANRLLRQIRAARRRHGYVKMPI